MIGSTPYVLIVTERNNWCFNNIGQALQRFMSEHYQFKVLPTGRIAGEHCDVLVSMWWDYTLRCKASVRTKAVITCLYDELSWHINESSRAQFRLVLKNTDVLACCNESIAERVKSVYGNECPTICLTEDGVDTSLFVPQPLPPKFSVGWTGNSQRATPGGPEDLKGLSIIKRAAQLAGVELQILDASHGGSWPHVEMPKFYTGISAVVIGSAFEGTPNPLLEGLACGRPVISTQVGLAPKAISDGKNGYLVARTAEAMAGAMRQMAGLGRMELEAMSREASCTARQKWDWTVKTQAWRTAITTALRVASLPKQPLSAPIEVQTPTAFQPEESLKPKRVPKGPPRVLLISDVPNWAFHVNMMDLEEYLGGQFFFDHWHVIDYVVGKKPPPDMVNYDAVFSVYHRWGIDGLLPWDRTVGSLRALWFYPERPAPPGAKEFALVNAYRAFHVVTKQNYEELKQACPNVVYLTNPVNMNRFKEPTPVDDIVIASWNGNAKHQSANGLDVKGFWSIIEPAVKAAKMRLEYAEYHTKRLAPVDMPEFYRRGNLAICMSLYEGACGRGDTPVVMADGSMQRLDEVKAGDAVLSRDGRSHQVEVAWCAGIPNELVEITTWGGKKLRFTREHKWPVWAWARKCLCGCGQDVKQGRLWVAKHSGSRGRKIRAIQVRGHGGSTTSAYRALPPNYEPLQKLRSDDIHVGDFLCIPRKYHAAPTTVTAEEARLLGYYIAEGCLLDGHGEDYAVEWVFNSNETGTWVQDIQTILLERGIASTVRQVPKKHSARLRTTNDFGRAKDRVSSLVRWLRAHGGELAHSKRFSATVMSWPLELKMELIKGLFRGDGHESWKVDKKHDWCSYSVCYGTVSKLLSQQVQLVLAQIGCAAGIVAVPPRITDLTHLGAKRTSQSREFYHVVVASPWAKELGRYIWGAAAKVDKRPAGHDRSTQRQSECHIDDDFIYVPVKKIEIVPNDEPVYNLTVEGDHSYLVDNVATYNSNSVMEAMAAGQALITTACGNAREMHDAQMEEFGESGIIILEERTIEALVGALLELKDDPKRVVAMGRLNRMEIEKRWSWRVWADRYASFLRKAL
jgi:glycosyltransferase involved in cell wall biosynthesis